MLEQNQTVALLKQDKEYLSKQLNETTPRLKLVEEKLQQTDRQLDDAKQAREDLYEKYLNSRCEFNIFIIFLNSFIEYLIFDFF